MGTKNGCNTIENIFATRVIVFYLSKRPSDHLKLYPHNRLKSAYICLRNLATGISNISRYLATVRRAMQ